jgi:hypothetical protein
MSRGRTSGKPGQTPTRPPRSHDLAEAVDGPRDLPVGVGPWRARRPDRRPCRRAGRTPSEYLDVGPVAAVVEADRASTYSMTRSCMPASEPLSKTATMLGWLRLERPALLARTGPQGRLLRIRVTEHLDRYVRCGTRSRADTLPHPPASQHGAERIAFTQHASLATTRALHRVVWTLWSRRLARQPGSAARPSSASSVTAVHVFATWWTARS